MRSAVAAGGGNGTNPSKPIFDSDIRTFVPKTSAKKASPPPAAKQKTDQSGGVGNGSTALVKYDPEFAVSQGLEDGYFNFETIRSMIPEGTPNTFYPSYGGEKYFFRINGKRIVLKWHRPEFSDANTPPGSNSALYNTAQIRVGNRYLKEYGGFTTNNQTNSTHIRLKD